MTGVYWDTSCVLKLYAREAGSELFLKRLEGQAGPVCSSMLLATEMAFAFHAKEARGEIVKRGAEMLLGAFEKDCGRGRFLLLPVGEDVRAEARRIARLCYQHSPLIPLRTMDGLHLATAKAAGCRQILTVDHRMQKAGFLLGIECLSA